MQIYAQLFQGGNSSAAAAASASRRLHRGDPAAKTAHAGAEENGTAERREQQQQQNREGDMPSTATAVAADNGEQEKEQVEEEEQQLAALVRSSVDSFFDLLYAKVEQTLGNADPRSKESASAESENQQQQQGAGGSGEDADWGLDPVKLGGVVAAVQQLVSDMEAVDPHVPQVRTVRKDDATNLVWVWVWGERGEGGGIPGSLVSPVSHLLRCSFYRPSNVLLITFDRPRLYDALGGLGGGCGNAWEYCSCPYRRWS